MAWVNGLMMSADDQLTFADAEMWIRTASSIPRLMMSSMS
jgi:hypothetical protein